MKKQKFYSLKQAAELLGGVSPRSMYRYINDKKWIKATKIGYWKIAEEDLKKFMREHSNIKPKKK